jgi:hypothetical protein
LEATKTIHEADLLAVRKRFLEVFVRSRPPLPPNALPTCGSFTRDHLIIGLFPQIIRILFKYDKDDFNSPYLYLYPISSCFKNLFKMKKNLQASLKDVLIELMDKYQFTQQQQLMCMPDLEPLPSGSVEVKDIQDN